MEKATVNIYFPMNLHKERVSYFSFSFFDMVLNPAIKKEPFPMENIVPNTTNNPIIDILANIEPLHLKICFIKCRYDMFEIYIEGDIIVSLLLIITY